MKASKDKLADYFKSVGKIIARFRKEKNYTLEELGLLIGHDRSNMKKIEIGRPLTLKTIIKLSIALGKEPKDFLNLDFDFHENELSGLIVDKKSPKKKPREIKNLMQTESKSSLKNSKKKK